MYAVISYVLHNLIYEEKVMTINSINITRTNNVSENERLSTTSLTNNLKGKWLLLHYGDTRRVTVYTFVLLILS